MYPQSEGRGTLLQYHTSFKPTHFEGGGGVGNEEYIHTIRHSLLSNGRCPAADDGRHHERAMILLDLMSFVAARIPDRSKAFDTM